MAVSLIKLCVGISSIEELESVQRKRRRQISAQDAEALNIHVTRNTPKRASEIIGKGSLYWVIKRRVVARQLIVDIKSMNIEGKKHCGIILHSEITRTNPKPCRPFQGWRYLELADAPADLSSVGDRPDDMPHHLQDELRSLGLL